MNQAGKDAGLRDGDSIKTINGAEIYDAYQIYNLFQSEGIYHMTASHPDEPEIAAINITEDIDFGYTYSDPTNTSPHICDDAT